MKRKMGNRIVAEIGRSARRRHRYRRPARAECVVYMGTVDMVAAQEPNVFRMRLLGTEVRPVESGSKTLSKTPSMKPSGDCHQRAPRIICWAACSASPLPELLQVRGRAADWPQASAR